MTAKAKPITAAEASRRAQVVRDENARKRAEATRKRVRAQRAQAKKDHEDFIAGLDENIQWYIDEAIKKGKKFADDVWVTSGACDTAYDAQNLFDNHVWLADIKKAIRKFRRRGYSVKQYVKCVEHCDCNDLTGNTTYSNSYHPCLKLEWK